MSQSAARVLDRESVGHAHSTLPCMVSVRRICDADPLARIEALRGGLPARWLADVAVALGWHRKRLIKALGARPAATIRRIQADQLLDVATSERLLALLDLILEVECIVERSGRPEGFDACEWLGDWLGVPLGALGFLTPGSFLDTHEGFSVVRKLIAQLESGVCT